MNEVNETVPFRLEAGASILNGLIDLPAAPGERPTVVICHGFKGFMEWGFFPYLATLLAERGFVAIRFNLPGTGMQPGDELAGLLAVLAGTGETLAPGRVDRSRLGLFGHGRGGGDAILAAARSPWRDRVRALVTWAAVADVDFFPPALRAPWLIVHGADDETVPVEEGRRLAGRAGGEGEKELRVIPGASHTFGSRHPFAGPTPQLIQALNATQRWFRAHL
ncbi:MAG TPA: hypothetical protein VIA62_24610 [Thermoanaerobaculia bacterium]|jgi:pimeloyl-ACP methyl ester carboxylesterase|nr:hypothetical protein [Thermoanaerobaculia bacterium]